MACGIAHQVSSARGTRSAVAFQSRSGRAGSPSPGLPSATAARRGSHFQPIARCLPAFQARLSIAHLLFSDAAGNFLEPARKHGIATGADRRARALVFDLHIADTPTAREKGERG